MTAIESATSSTIDAEIAVAKLQNIGSSTTSGTLSTTVPRPSIIGDKSTAACAEGVVLALALSNGRGVMDIWSAGLGVTE